ncbi:MAG: hypothetical protein V4722_21695 [Bacteroidota bacterium]
MNLIDKELIKINFIVAQYTDDRPTVYEHNTKIIADKLAKIIDELAPIFGLTSVTTVRKIKHYSFSPRVKDAESLKEKLIRNNLFNSFVPLLPEGFNPADGGLIKSVKDKLIESDDLIGIKLLTDLNTDCLRMYELINSSEFNSKAKAQDIYLNEEDLNKQPQPMRNGLDIYKIRAKYDKYNFELQIKSKIISAWGDMEHSIFYKDYAISPVRDTAQKSMNHVGKLLFQIDDFVESIRNANKDYSENAYALMFLQWFDNKYNQRIRNSLDNVGYRMDGISELLYASYKKLGGTEDFATRKLKFDHFEFNINDPQLLKYVARRNKIYDLKILEAIVMSWCLESEREVTQENIEETLTRYIKVLIRSASSFLCERHQAYEIEEMESLVTKFYDTGFKYDCSERFLLSLNKLDDYLTTCFYIDDLLESVIENKIIKIIKRTVFVQLNKGKTLECLTDLLSHQEPEIDIETFKIGVMQLRDLIDGKSRKNRIDVLNIVKNIIELI